VPLFLPSIHPVLGDLPSAMLKTSDRDLMSS
jgi:hypothetical protein